MILCDFNLTYQGCTGKQKFVYFDLLTVICHTLLALAYIYLLVQRLKTRSRQLNSVEQVVILCIVANFIRAGYKLMTLNSGNEFASEAAYLIFLQFTIVLSFLDTLCAAIVLKSLMLTVVQLGTATQHYSPVSFFGKKIDPSSALKILRLVIITYNIVVTILWLVVLVPGVTVAQFAFYRRMVFLASAVVSAFVSAPIHVFFGYRLLKQFGGHAKPELATTIVSSMPQSVPIEKPVKPVSQRERVTGQLQKNLKYVFYCVMIAYIGFGFVCASYCLVNDFVTDESMLFLTKVVVDCFSFGCGFFMILFMARL
ncbi:hypothetical protein EDD86DRAFT_197184, partial [Gorgonomyces haynaldii]